MYSYDNLEKTKEIIYRYFITKHLISLWHYEKYEGDNSFVSNDDNLTFSHNILSTVYKRNLNHAVPHSISF